ncbi:RGS9 [Cordylochernes scorpioides]|uniref:RGS9 n=1 Tax=Cordylochernes scorpioides TaxID=51811 RepID=A0ABY6LGQ0_9ARAC|nr:RGS9 [Cordylochernes scorpioides]
MPGHRKRRQFKQTDAFTRGMVIGLKRAGWSIRQIAADTHLGASTVHRLWRRWLEQGNVAIKWIVGATRVTSARVDRRILRQAVAAPQATCTAIPQHVQDTLDHSISTRTISRRLGANGLHSCRPLRRLPLTPPNRRQRLEWCRARSTWMTEWHRVVFSDESRFCLSSDSRRVRVWRRRGEMSNPAAIVERPTVRQRGIMVWGAIAYDSRSPLLRIQGTMTAQRYVDDVLRPVTLPYLQGYPMPFISRITPDRTLLALANKLCKMYRCFPGHRTLLISHRSSTSGTSLDAVCMPCHSRVQKTNCGKCLLRDRKKADKVVLESQEKAYWQVHRPPPGCINYLEQSPIASKRTREKRLRKDSKTDHIEKLKNKAEIPKHQILQALEGLIHSTEDTEEFDPFLHGCFPQQPLDHRGHRPVEPQPALVSISHSTIEADVPTERRLRKWTISLDHLLGDPTGLREFEEYLKKEFSHENIAFWRAVQELKRAGGPLDGRVRDIHEQFLEPGAPFEVNLDSRTLEHTLEAIKKPSRYAFEQAQQHVFQLMKSDTYPRFLRSDHYRGLCERAQSQISHKKRFCNFGSMRGRRSRLQPEPETGRWLFSGRHSHSTSDLHNLDNGAAAKPPPANSTSVPRG